MSIHLVIKESKQQRKLDPDPTPENITDIMKNKYGSHSLKSMVIEGGCGGRIVEISKVRIIFSLFLLCVR